MNPVYEAAARALGHTVAQAEREPGADIAQIGPLFDRLVTALAAEFTTADPDFDVDGFITKVSYFRVAREEDMAIAEAVRARTPRGVVGGDGYKSEIDTLERQGMEVSVIRFRDGQALRADLVDGSQVILRDNTLSAGAIPAGSWASEFEDEAGYVRTVGTYASFVEALDAAFAALRAANTDEGTDLDH